MRKKIADVLFAIGVWFMRKASRIGRWIPYDSGPLDPSE